MRMTKVLVLMSVFLSFSAFGCTDNFGPAQTVKSAYSSLEKNETKDFISLLSGEALTAYGSVDAMAALQRGLNGMNLQVGKETLENTVNDTETWSVDVTTKEDPTNPVLTAQLLCDVGYVNGTESKTCTIFSIILDL